MLAALRDPAQLPAFHAALADAELIVPLYPARDGEVDPRMFVHVVHEGRAGVAAFTSLRQMARADPSTRPCVQLTGRVLASGWDGTTSLLLNPGGELGLELTADFISSWADD